MKLHAFDSKLPVAKAHDGAGSIFFRGPSADLELRRQILFFDDEGVVKRKWQSWAWAGRGRLSCYRG